MEDRKRHFRVPSRAVAVACVLLVVLVLPLGAAINNSVPVDHRVYRLLDAAEIRGIIEHQSTVRPYSARKILGLLEIIAGDSASISPDEQLDVASLIDELNHTYGIEPAGRDDLLSNGFVRTHDEDTGIGASLGAVVSTAQTFRFGTDYLDSRNAIDIYLRGDLGSHISYNMDFTYRADKLDNRVFLATDFTIPGEGFYMQLLDGGRQMREIPSDALYSGLATSPELNASFLDDRVNVRFGSIKRNWGPGLDNFLVSSSARSVDGIEIQVEATPWLRYSVMTASMGIFSLKTLDGDAFYSDWMQGNKEDYRFDNNLSTQRVEIDLFPHFTFGIYESVVWKKRFELGYLNPLAVYMFEQNNLGDLDNMLAGVDFNYIWDGKARFYGGLATSEMHDVGSPLAMLRAPRNILALQLGAVMPLPSFGSFSSLTFQWTYLAPFFYSHYPTIQSVGKLSENGDTIITTGRGNSFTLGGSTNNPTVTITNGYADDRDADGRTETVSFADSDTWFSKDGRLKVVKDGNSYTCYETTNESAYVNKGENLGYPLNPNSMEFLVQLDAVFGRGWMTSTSLKYQVRSGQYGFEVGQYMDYSDHSSYPEKDFWGYTFCHDLTLQTRVAKQLDNLPIELYTVCRLTTTWERDRSGYGFDGRGGSFGSWEDPSFACAVTIGGSIYY